MEILNFFAQDAQGNIMPSADCYLYAPGTTNLVSGLVDINGIPISNPFQASNIGQVQFGAPNGVYDLRIKKGVSDTTIRIQCADIVQAMGVVDSILGSHPSNPSTRNDGSPLQQGDDFWNSTEKTPYWWTGSSWSSLDSSVRLLEQRLADPSGSGLIGFKPNNLSVWMRTLQDKVGERVSPQDFGGIFDGTLHPLSDRYETVEQARFSYPGVWIPDLTRSIDYAATQAAILHCESTGKALFIYNVGGINDELIHRKPIRVYGTNPGYGYNTQFYNQIAGFTFFGTGTRRVRTRQKYRASAADPQDNPLSVGINIQAANTIYENISVTLNGGRGAAPGFFGDDWDCGFFFGCRIGVKLINVHVSSGYWRDSGIRIDVTQPAVSGGAGRFKDPFGVRYSNDGPHGADGTSLAGVYTYGGFFGVKVQGSDPAPGQTGLGPMYYDEDAGLVADTRGGFGFSDFEMNHCTIYGPEHSSFRRIYDYDAATASRSDVPRSGAYYVSGLASGSSSAIQGHRIVNTRFSSWEACRIYLGRVNRVVFIGCHQENHGGLGQTTAGVPTTASYGPVLRSPYCTNLKTIACITDFIGALMCPTMEGDSAVASDTGNTILTNLTMITGVGITLDSTAGIARILNNNGELDLRGQTNVRIRNGSTTVAQFNSTESIFSASSAVRPGSDDSTTLGTASQRWKVVFSATDSISISDARHKSDVRRMTVAEIAVAKALVDEIGMYQFLDSVAENGSDVARWHVGMTVQRAIEIFEAHGLDPFRNAFVCYDEWEDQYEEYPAEYEMQPGELDPETGEEVSPSEVVMVKPAGRTLIREAGNIYSFRNDQIAFAMLAGVAATQSSLEVRISALEKINA